MPSDKFSLVVSGRGEGNPLEYIPLWPIPDFIYENSRLLDAALQSIGSSSNLESLRGEDLDARLWRIRDEDQAGLGTIIDKVDPIISNQMTQHFQLEGYDCRERALHFFQLYTSIQALIHDGVISEVQGVSLFQGKTFANLMELDAMVGRIEQYVLHAERSAKEVQPLTDEQLYVIETDIPFGEVGTALRAEQMIAATARRDADRALRTTSKTERPSRDEINRRLAQQWYGDGDAGPAQIEGPKRRTWWQWVIGREP